MFRTCPTCNGDGLLYELPGEPFCSACDGTGDVLPDGSRGHALSHGDPPIGDRRGFKTGDIVSLKNRDSHNVGTITEETRYRPTDGKGPVFHFHGDHLSATASCTVRPHEIEHCDKWGRYRAALHPTQAATSEASRAR